MDLWRHFEGERLVREVRDTNQNAFPDVLTRYNEDGVPVVQELAEGRHARPNKKLFLDPDGSVAAQCLDTNGDGRFDARAAVEGGLVVRVLLDQNGDGIAEQLEHYEGGVRVGLEADTNGDRRPDVVQVVAGGEVVRQDEDSDYDGTMDRRFEGEAQSELSAPAPPELPALDCGGVDRFWAKRG
jgi:hypothetical protein